MGEPPPQKWQAMESEMEKFEKELAQISKPPQITPSFIPASVRKFPQFNPPPRPRLTPVVISGGPQLYRKPSVTTISSAPVTLMRPNSIIRQQRPIIPTTPTSAPINITNLINPPPPSSSIDSTNSSINLPPSTEVKGEINSTNSSQILNSNATPGSSVDKNSTPGPSGAAGVKGKKKKKKKKTDEEKKPKKYIRSAGGTIWEDTSLLDWDPKDFRLFCGDLGNDVTDEVLTRVFGRYPSFVKAKVIRDKRTNKTKGYGFVSFKDPADFVKAIRELDGRYVGSRPIKLRKSTWDSRELNQVRKREKLQKSLLGLKP